MIKPTGGEMVPTNLGWSRNLDDLSLILVSIYSLCFATGLLFFGDRWEYGQGFELAEE